MGTNMGSNYGTNFDTESENSNNLFVIDKCLIYWVIESERNRK